MTDYGRLAAMRSAKRRREQKLAKSSESTPKIVKRKGAALEYDAFAKYESDGSYDYIDWLSNSTASCSDHIANALCDKSDNIKGSSKCQILVLPTGLGKTAIAIESLAKMQATLGHKLHFIILVSRTIKNKCSWQEMISAWNKANSDNMLEPVLIETYDRVSSALSDKSTLVKLINALGEDGVVLIDEIHNFKNPTSKRSKQLQKLSFSKKLGLTATPFTSNIILDAGSYLIMGGYYKHKTDFLVKTRLVDYETDRGQFLIFDKKNKISDVIWPEYVDVRRQLASIMYKPDIDMSDIVMPTLTNHYDQLPFNEELDADLRSLAVAYRKRMFDNVMELRMALIERIYCDNARVKHLMNICKNESVWQPLVFYLHTVVRDKLLNELSHAGFEPRCIAGGFSASDVDFDDGQPILIQYQSGSEGLDSAKRSTCSVFYENQGSSLRWTQAKGRNLRRNMTQPVDHHYMISDCEFDRALFENLQTGRELTEKMLDQITLDSIGLNE